MWLRCGLQGDGLCQADEGFDAKQVGQHHRFLCQELLKAQHGVCIRHDALSTAQDCVWRLLCLLVGVQVVSEGEGADKGSGVVFA